MKRSFIKVLAMYLFSSTCFACTTNFDNLLVESGLDDGEISTISTIESSPSLLTDVKATTYFLGWSNVGDTTIRVKADKDVLPTLTGKKVDLTPITKNTEGNFRLLSVGGSLSAGFRDGGLYREGQLTAFPNLIARQMGVTFDQPLFDANDGNGSGYKTLVDIEPIASFKMVKNNLGYEDSKAEKLKPFKGKNIDHYAFPGMNYDLGYQGSNEKMNQKFSDRIFDNALKKSDFNAALIKKQSTDFFIIEAGYDDIVEGIMIGGGGGVPNQNAFTVTQISETFKTLATDKAKGVVLNVPDVLDFPYFNQITNDKLNKLSGVVIRVQRGFGSKNYRSFNPLRDKLLPSPTVEKLMRGELKNLILLGNDEVLSKDDGDDEWNRMMPGPYNDVQISRKAKASNLPVVDIYGLYKKIFAGNYTTDDGVKVNPDWVKGNFFSADGIYPTAFGQAVIANEVIKTMNQFYKLSIPLVDTRFFLKK